MRLGNSFTTKAILVGVLGLLSVMCFVLYPVQLLAKQLSYLTLFATFALLVISLKCSMDTEIMRKRRWLRAHHILFELLVPLNMLVTAVYWTLLREPVVASCEGNQVWILHSTTVHLAPIIASVLHFAVTDIVVKASHSMTLLPVAFGYLAYNCYVTKMTGVPVYWFLDWKDHYSLIIGLSLTLGCVLFFCVMSWFTKIIRRLRYSKSFKSKLN